MDSTTIRGDPTMDPTVATMDDDQADRCLGAALTLAVAMRDDGPDVVRKAALELLWQAGDPVAALCIVAALVDVDAPVVSWWEDGPRVTPAKAPVVLPRGRTWESYFGPADPADLEELVDAICPPGSGFPARKSA